MEVWRFIALILFYLISGAVAYGIGWIRGARDMCEYCRERQEEEEEGEDNNVTGDF